MYAKVKGKEFYMAFSRISARRGELVTLPARFLKGGRLADPFAIYRVEIYRGSVAPDNIVDSIVISGPASTEYPAPLIHGDTSGTIGIYALDWMVPPDAVVPDVYFDVWYFYSNDPRSGSDSSLDDFTSLLDKSCNRFWVYPDSWYVDGGLQTINLGFEPLNNKFNKPEIRPLEVGMMPLPLYDYDYNLVTPILPYLDAKITIKTENDELIQDSQVMSIKLRQGSYRANPFVLSYSLNTAGFFIGTYKYRITITLPDGSTRTSSDLYFTIA